MEIEVPRCVSCYGNDQDRPCAYPGDGMPGCLRDQRRGYGLVNLADGVYRVETATFVAGFEVQRSRVVRCAPILRKRIGYWSTVAKKVG